MSPDKTACVGREPGLDRAPAAESRFPKATCGRPRNCETELSPGPFWGTEHDLLWTMVPCSGWDEQPGRCDSPVPGSQDGMALHELDEPALRNPGTPGLAITPGTCRDS